MIFVHIHFSSISRLPRIDTEPLRLLIQDSLYDDGSDDADDEEDNDLKISSETAPTTETAEAGRVKDNSLAAENVKDIFACKRKIFASLPIPKQFLASLQAL